MTNACHPNQINRKWLHSISMSGRLQHPWIYSSLKTGKLTFTWIPLLACTDLLLPWDVLIIVECRELWSLPQSDLLALNDHGLLEGLWEPLVFPVTYIIYCFYLGSRYGYYLTHIHDCEHHHLFLLPYQRLSLPCLASICWCYKLCLRTRWVASTLRDAMVP